MQHKKHNGYYNYETWLVALWVDSYENTQNMRYGWLRESSTENPKYPAYYVADRLKEWLHEENPLADSASIYSDLLGAAISEVNFDEIAYKWLEDFEEE